MQSYLTYNVLYGVLYVSLDAYKMLCASHTYYFLHENFIASGIMNFLTIDIHIVELPSSMDG